MLRKQQMERKSGSERRADEKAITNTELRKRSQSKDMM